MVRIRLRRMGKTKRPTYRVVVADSRSPRDGKFIEIIGHYDPVQQPKVLHIKKDRARYWVGVGAQPSDAVVKLFKRVGVLDEAGKVLPPSEEELNGVAVETTATPVAATPVVAESPLADAAPAPEADEPAPAIAADDATPATAADVDEAVAAADVDQAIETPEPAETTDTEEEPVTASVS